MKNRDRDEELIYKRISQMEMDTSNIKEKVLEDLEPKKELKKKPVLVSGLAVGLSIFLVVGASASILKNSDWFMNKFDPTFREIVEPIDIYSEDQGIKLELIAGQKYDNNALVYLSIQDTSGKNRITEDTVFRDGFFLGMDESGTSYGYGIEDKMLSFDEETNTIYYEFNIRTDLTSPLSESLSLGTSKIYYDFLEYKDELIEIPAKALEDRSYFSLDKSKIWGGKNSLDTGEKTLEIGRYSDMPHGDKRQWISNIGLIDGRLHLQVGSDFKEDFGPIDPDFELKDKDGRPIVYESSKIFLTDGDRNILNLDQSDFDLVQYKYEEFIFPLVDQREVYEVYYSGTILDGLSGHWEVQADLSGENKALTIDKELDLGDYKFEKISITPLGLKAGGSYRGASFKEAPKISLETKKTLIELESSSGKLDKLKSEFDLDYKSSIPIKIDEVSFIIIDGVKIPVN